VAVVAAAELRTDLAEVDVQLVVDHHEVVRRDLVVREQLGDRTAGLVHVRTGGGETTFSVSAPTAPTPLTPIRTSPVFARCSAWALSFTPPRRASSASTIAPTLCRWDA